MFILYYAVIDLGSNTVRLVVYSIKNNKFSRVIDEKSALGILNYIEDDFLTEDGILELIQVLSNMYKSITLMQCEHYWCFATASLRNTRNLKEVVARVLDATHVHILPISGADEAFYDFISLKSMITSPDFVGCDLGGGSLQIISCKNQKLADFTSLPLGSLRMYRNYIHDFFPTPQEVQAMTDYIHSCLEPYPFITTHHQKSLYVMGGTARAVVKLYRALTHTKKAIHGYTLSLSELDTLKNIIEKLGLDGIKIINQILSDRTFTVIPGLIVIYTLAQKMNVENIIVAKASVREGFLIKHTMNGDYHDKRKI